VAQGFDAPFAIATFANGGGDMIDDRAGYLV
jgi:hypothetical protein